MDVNMSEQHILRVASGPLCCAPLLQAPLADDEAVELAEVLKALADPVRLRLVSLIAAAPGGEACTCDLPALVDRSQPTVSHHLSQLVAAGILEREQRGKWAWFRVKDDRLDAVRRALSG
jgi:ArsR family transcriptional regulator